MFVNALLVSLVTIIATIDYNGPLFMIHRPLVVGAMTGFVLGDLTQGVIIGAALELMWLGVTGIGGYTPPDTISGAALGTAFAILAGGGVEEGIAIAVPISLITQQLDVFAKTLDIFFVHKADADAKKGDISKVNLYHFGSLFIIVLFKVLPVFLAILIGAEYVEYGFNLIPDIIMSGLSVAGGVLPAVGFAMLLNMMMKKNSWVFLMIGFLGAAFLQLDTVGIALLGIIVVFFFDSVNKNEIVGTAVTNDSNEDTEEYDL